MPYELKPLIERNLETAVTLAKHYRDLNQPEEAESICRDILAVAPDHDAAWRILGLALTDRFPTEWMSLFEAACESFRRLPSAYERVYYTGIAWERFARAQVMAGRAHNAVHAYEEALARFEEAERLGAKDEPSPILHYNRCVRALTENEELARASSIPVEPDFDRGD